MSACDGLYSDTQVSGRRHEAAMREWVRSSRIASAQAAPANPVVGDALVALLSGKTHVHEYRTRSEDATPYLVTYAYFRADGRYIFLDTQFRERPDEAPADRWRVDGQVLCITTNYLSVSTDCYTVRREAAGQLQYWIHKPGDQTDGLLTMNVNIVRSGLQQPAFRRIDIPR
jgi:hypothetical protein